MCSNFPTKALSLRRKSAIVISLCLALMAGSVSAQRAPIVVNPAKILCSSFLGFGVQWSPYPWYDISDKAWQRIYDRLDYMRVPIVRVMTRDYTYCDGFDGSGHPIYSWDNGHMKKLYRLLDYCESRHVKVILGEWDDPASPEDRPNDGSDRLQKYRIDCVDPRWTELVCDFITHLTKDKGYTCIRFFNLINEPNGKWSHCGDFDRWRAAVTNLSTEMKRRGIDKTIRLIGPDATGEKSYYWIDRAVIDTSALIGAYDLHDYVAAEDLESGHEEMVLSEKRNFIDRYDPKGKSKPFFMGEIGMNHRGPVSPQGGEDSHPKVYEQIYGVWMTDFSIQAARAGMAGTIAWDLDDAMHIVKTKDNGWPNLHRTLFKKWGFFNSLAEEIGHPEDANLRPWFFTWSLMARSFPPGCKTLDTSNPGLQGVRTLAASIDDGVSIAIVNDSDQDYEVRVTAPGLNSAKPLLKYTYSKEPRKVDALGYPLPEAEIPQPDYKAGLDLVLRARSVNILTTVR